jgi:predicted dithiol-disulfide oxidoreductase (DUF899 family)
MNASADIPHEVVTRDEWLLERKALLGREKELTRLYDQICAERRALPWVKIGKNYMFDGPDGRVTLGDLFDGRNQLMVYHFMFGPDWDEGCPGCSFFADHVDGARQHFENADLSFAAVSRAPWEKIAPFKERMGWNFPWVSSFGSDFNYDFHVSFTPEQIANKDVVYNFERSDETMDELPGGSVFFKNTAGEILHTYSSYGRGGESLIGAFQFLDLVPKGRNETTSIMDWVRHHDRYDGVAHACCGGE